MNASDVINVLLRVALGVALVWGIMWFVRRTEERRQKPLVTERARVAAKRVDTSAAPLWYVCFETEDGGKTELRVTEEVYGYLAPGDLGTLSFRGQEFVKFQREQA